MNTARMANFILPALVVLALAACSSPGRDRPGSGPGPMSQMQGGQLLKPAGLLFASFDRDGDYRVSRQEFDTGLAAAYARADADGSHTLALFEYQDWAGQALGSKTALPAWIGIDRDGDNSISQAEFGAEFERMANEYGLANAGGMALAELTRTMDEVMADMPLRGMMRTGREPGGDTPGPGQPMDGGALDKASNS